MALPLSARDKIAFTPERLRSSEAPPVFYLRPFTLVDRARWTASLAAQGIALPPGDDAMDGIRRRAMTEAGCTPDEVDAIERLIEKSRERTRAQIERLQEAAPGSSPVAPESEGNPTAVAAIPVTGGDAEAESVAAPEEEAPPGDLPAGPTDDETQMLADLNQTLLQNSPEYARAIEARMLYAQVAPVLALQMQLVGWENAVDGEGRKVKFERHMNRVTDAALSRLDALTLMELATEALRLVRPQGTDAKN